METQRFKPLIDKLFWIIFIPTSALTVGMVVISAFAPTSLFITIPVALTVFYLLLSPLFSYAELREHSLFIKYGLILKKDIPYDKIRGVEKDRKFYSESMLSIKNSFEHVNVKYNSFDITTISVVHNDDFMKELKARCPKK